MKRLLVGITLLLAACSSPPESGKIIAKSHQPAHYNEWVQHICAGYNAQGGCTVSIPIFHRDFVPDSWYLKIRNEKEDDEGWQQVSQEQFNSLEVGSCWNTTAC